MAPADFPASDARLLLFNTRTQRKELFEPTGNPVTLYVCGVTPYDTTHLGHARTYLVFDILQRHLMAQNLAVRYVQNVTDIDDPLFERAAKLGVDFMQLADECIDIFLNDLDALNIMRPTVFPRVRDEIPGILDMVQLLVDNGMAYPRDGRVYFRAARFPGYADMSLLDRQGMLAANAETGEDPEDPRKEDPLDFRLWRPSAPGEPAWPTPWGSGRPGWHIECSSMANRHLGPQVDIHGGGEDLVFPHHCDEIAQSESATGVRPFVRYWMHVGIVRMDGEKMSKSRGNLAFVRDLVPEFGGNALRYYLLGFSYRSQFEYVARDLAIAAERWRGIADACRGPMEAPDPSPEGDRLSRLVRASLDNDLDTPAALAAITELGERIAEDQHPGDRAVLRQIAADLGFRFDSDTGA
ncbi:MAG: L-cysteine:1D-myo-inositol 2-amino-2-deoxy-alpha-D-glucopyranoside ligase [Chloroflexota bacterium]|jgi:L-cysteine:1D-myo-inositol 2-amino-2-deoxy-alpha-D-glucopyranoside ligase|nr:L-cysteine:1D-myo-inositol 2-amino-2-deoxy-alpha-D-glucopyranoside ligase [Chloroflexota bacterium]